MPPVTAATLLTPVSAVATSARVVWVARSESVEKWSRIQRRKSQSAPRSSSVPVDEEPKNRKKFSEFLRKLYALMMSPLVY